MTDLSDRLASALRVQFPEWAHIVRGAGTFADGLLSLPGIAIVELPDASEEWPDQRIWLDGDVRATPSGVFYFAVGPRLVPADAREVAAALLAAANAAEDGCPPIPDWRENLAMKEESE